MQDSLDDIKILLEVLPPEIIEIVYSFNDLNDLLEIIFDLGRPVEVRLLYRTVVLKDKIVDKKDISYITGLIGEFGDDNRAGIERTLHRISAIRNRKGDIVGLTLRVGRALYGTIAIIREELSLGKSILLLGKPGVGKTTLLREGARVLSDELGKRVIVVDTSNEIGGDGDIPHPAIGNSRRMQVPKPNQQHDIMIEAVENHMPEVIIIDEIGREEETAAARTIAERGVVLIATAHGNTLGNLLQNPTLSDLVGGVHAVTLGDEEAKRRRTQKTVLERKAPPTFDILIEIQDRDTIAVHHDVSKVVDAFLRGYEPKPEIRKRTEKGIIQIYSEELPNIPEESEPVEASIIKLFPFGVNKHKLEKAIQENSFPITLAKDVKNADILFILKSNLKRKSTTLKMAYNLKIPVYTIKNNTVPEMVLFLKLICMHNSENSDVVTEAKSKILDTIRTNKPQELSPQGSQIRKIQHTLIDKYGLKSESKGEEPFRRVVIYPK